VVRAHPVLHSINTEFFLAERPEITRIELFLAIMLWSEYSATEILKSGFFVSSAKDDGIWQVPRERLAVAATVVAMKSRRLARFGITNSSLRKILYGDIGSTQVA